MPKLTITLQGVNPAVPGRTVTTLTPTGGTIPGVLQDSSDATYVREAASGLPADLSAYDFGSLGGYQQAPAQRVVAVCPWVRAKPGGPKVVTVNLGGATYMGGEQIVEGVQLALPVSQSAAAVYQTPVQLGQQLNPVYGAEWAAGPTWPTLTFRDPNTSANRAYVYEAGVYAYTVKDCTVGVPSSPSGTITTTQRPTLTTLLSQLVESWQLIGDGTEVGTAGLVAMQIFRSSDVGAATAPPNGVAPVWSAQFPYVIDQYIDGVTLSQLTFTQHCPVSLPNDTYVLYVSAIRCGVLPANDQQWLLNTSSGSGKWQRCSWTQNVAGPAAPTVQLTMDPVNQLVAIVATGQAVAGYDSTTAQMDVQRLVGGVWRNVRNMVGVGVTVGSPTALGNDLECDRAVTNTYRVRFHMVLVADGTVAYSPWTQQTVTGPPVSGTGWNLKTVDLPASSWLGAPVLTEPSEQLQCQETVFIPLDRDYPVVVRGSIGGAAGTLDFLAQGAAAVAALEALVAYEGVIYLETAFGDSKWIAVTDGNWKRQGTSAAPRRIGTITYTEVGSGLGTSSV